MENLLFKMVSMDTAGINEQVFEIYEHKAL